ncbi:type IX secretion system membrane protein PorP/SprF [Pedobacter sp. BS3]|uniref:PorP/SprF family type IX secretion system membrane protein n=1 Tax=Pedobacter sp. BS3 TaxID=2567937 RepID=UPI0011EE3B0E|nr:PorP/SprF family type IX secretion system membrane protein [Pedobacter sp. BS3]TZF84860.1 type IX secretion system membrane protein PorP/SprF [Pedobacter sp. BS3]
MIRKKNYCLFALTLGLIITFNNTKAQINPVIGLYYQNQYLANPAMAGLEKGVVLNAAYKQGFIKNNSTNLADILTAEYQLNGKMGLGLQLNTDKDGLVRANRYALSYAYHLQLTGNSMLNFGISAGIATERIDESGIVGDSDDMLIEQYNNIKPYADADFGLAYTTPTITVQAAVTNLRNVFYDTENAIYTPTTFYTAISYKYAFSAIKLEPKVVYRGVRNYDNIVDAGLNATFFEDKFNLLAMYHSSNNATLGFGYSHKKQLQFLLAYTLPVNNNLTVQTNGDIELGLRINILNKQ